MLASVLTLKLTTETSYQFRKKGVKCFNSASRLFIDKHTSSTSKKY